MSNIIDFNKKKIEKFGKDTYIYVPMEDLSNKFNIYNNTEDTFSSDEQKMLLQAVEMCKGLIDKKDIIFDNSQEKKEKFYFDNISNSIKNSTKVDLGTIIEKSKTSLEWLKKCIVMISKKGFKYIQAFCDKFQIKYNLNPSRARYIIGLAMVMALFMFNVFKSNVNVNNIYPNEHRASRIVETQPYTVAEKDVIYKDNITNVDVNTSTSSNKERSVDEAIDILQNYIDTETETTVEEKSGKSSFFGMFSKNKETATAQNEEDELRAFLDKRIAFLNESEDAIIEPSSESRPATEGQDTVSEDTSKDANNSDKNNIDEGNENNSVAISKNIESGNNIEPKPLESILKTQILLDESNTEYYFDFIVNYKIDLNAIDKKVSNGTMTITVNPEDIELTSTEFIASSKVLELNRLKQDKCLMQAQQQVPMINVIEQITTQIMQDHRVRI